MAVYKRGKTYWFEFVFNGQRIRESAQTSNRRAAENIEAAYRIKLAQGEVGILEKKAVPSFAAALKAFLTWSEIHHADHPNTHKRYAVSGKTLLAYFGNTKLDAITPEDVERYKTMRLQTKSERTGRLLKPATVNRELACLKIVFNHFIRQDVLAKNPVSRVKFPAENNEQTRVLSPEEERLYLAAASQPLYDIATLILQTGCRPEEIYTLTATNVNLEQGFLQITKGKTKAARRRIPLTKTAQEILQRRIDEAKGVYLFPHKDDPNKAILKVNNAHYGALKRSGIAKCTIYSLRHTFATRAAMSGTDLVTLAALLGHSRVQMVLRYSHPTEEHKLNAIRKLEVWSREREMAEFQVGDVQMVN